MSIDMFGYSAESFQKDKIEMFENNGITKLFNISINNLKYTYLKSSIT